MLIAGKLLATMLVMGRLPDHAQPNPKILIKGTKPLVWFPLLSYGSSYRVVKDDLSLAWSLTAL